MVGRLCASEESLLVRLVVDVHKAVFLGAVLYLYRQTRTSRRVFPTLFYLRVYLGLPIWDRDRLVRSGRYVAISSPSYKAVAAR